MPLLDAYKLGSYSLGGPVAKKTYVESDLEVLKTTYRLPPNSTWMREITPIPVCDNMELINGRVSYSSATQARSVISYVTGSTNLDAVVLLSNSSSAAVNATRIAENNGYGDQSVLGLRIDFTRKKILKYYGYSISNYIDQNGRSTEIDISPSYNVSSEGYLLILFTNNSPFTVDVSYQVAGTKIIKD